MKRLNKLLTASILAAGSIFLMSCQDVIFEEIRKEVKLEDAQIAGDVRSIVRYKEASSGKEYIYVQNGNLFKKCTDTKEDAETLHNWQKVSKPSGSGDIRFCNKLAADSSYLYAQIVTLKNDTDESEYVPTGTDIWCYDGSEWKIVTINGNAAHTTGQAVLFCNNAFENSQRRAYIRYRDTTEEKYLIMKLDGTSAGPDMASDDAENLSTTPSRTANACTNYKGTDYFTAGEAITTDSTDTYMYASANTQLYFYNGTDWLKSEGNLSAVDIDNSDTIYSLSCSRDYILIGTSGGIKHSMIDTDGKPIDVSSFKSNAQSALSSSYIVYQVLVQDPELPEDEGTLYGTTTFEGSSSSSSATVENCGLWAYYKNTKKWNRE